MRLPGIAIGVPFGTGGFNWENYWATRLDTWHKKISDSDFVDSINSLNAKKIPICNYFDATKSDYASRAVADYLSAATSGSVTAFVKVSGTQIHFFSSVDLAAAVRYINFVVEGNNKISIYVRGVANNLMQTTNALSLGWHTVKCISTGLAYGIEVDGSSVAITVASGTNNGNWFAYVTARDNVCIGATLDTSPDYGTGSVSWVKVDDGVNGYWICDNNKYIYDVSGNGYHMTFAGTGARIVGDTSVANYKLTNGFTTYGKQNSISIQVPRLVSGTKIISPTLPAGYTEIQDVAGVPTGDNGCDYIIDFDPLNSADARLDVFDKSNATIHVATASMSYYNSSEIYQWLLTELYDPRIYFPYFNVGYRGRIFSKITSKLVSGLYYPIGYSEQLNCILDQTLADEWKAFDYCGLKIYALTDAEGNPVYDGNDYVIIV